MHPAHEAWARRRASPVRLAGERRVRRAGGSASGDVESRVMRSAEAWISTFGPDHDDATRGVVLHGRTSGAGICLDGADRVGVDQVDVLMLDTVDDDVRRASTGDRDGAPRADEVCVDAKALDAKARHHAEQVARLDRMLLLDRG